MSVYLKHLNRVVLYGQLMVVLADYYVILLSIVISVALTLLLTRRLSRHSLHLRLSMLTLELLRALMLSSSVLRYLNEVVQVRHVLHQILHVTDTA